MRDSRARARRGDPRPQLPAARGAGRRRLRRRLARALARGGAPRTRRAIVFCGVHFMAETAAILSPEKTVLIPDLGAGCSLAASIDADQLRAWKAEHPGRRRRLLRQHDRRGQGRERLLLHLGQRRAVIEAIPADREILFLPDLYLGLWLERVTGPQAAALARRVPRPRGHPAGGHRALAGRGARTPSCSSTPSAAARARRWPSRTSARTSSRPRGWSTSPSSRRSRTFIVATETGILHRLHKEVPGKSFEARQRARRSAAS